MKNIGRFILILLLAMGYTSCAQQRPFLIIPNQGVDNIRKGVKAPLFEKSLEEAKHDVDIEIAIGIDVPLPLDMAGGYTHERHKLNYITMHKAGALFQLTGNESYAVYIRDMLITYAKEYPKWPVHPTNRSYATGKIFWQCLNDANWLVYVAQAYDCIHDFVSKEERKIIEQDLLKPLADFISVENPQFFNRVHNHSTWGNAAVGMIGLTIGDELLVKRALYGLPFDEIDKLAKDNDGGFIYEEGKLQAGFFAQIDNAFSPDGYYTEGPYYQRYAMTPFLYFAMALENNRPDLKIFEYRDHLLRKAVYTLLYQTDGNGDFFPINDAQKGMSIMAPSLVEAVDIAYSLDQNDELLSIATVQNKVQLDHTGYAVAKAIANNQSKTFVKKSIQLSDGAKGDEGALGILRSPNSESDMALVFKYTAQGLGHGHFDKLSYLLYDGSTEVLQDYGAARWVNIDQKGGGRYLKENTSWAKQSIAHNTLIVDGKSHFNGDYDIANSLHSDPYLFDISNPNTQIVSAKELNAYEGIKLQRTLIMLNHDEFVKPIIIDLFAVISDMEHQYDLAFQYQEQLMETDLDYKTESQLLPFGSDHGYQHIWKEATAKLAKPSFQFTWFKDNKFYTMTSDGEVGDECLMARIGANDPQFNLRRDALLIHRKKGVKSTLFANAIESHGDYSPVSEIPIRPYPQVSSIDVVYNDNDYSAVTISTKDGSEWRIVISNNNTDNQANHQIDVSNEIWSWKGPFMINKIN